MHKYIKPILIFILIVSFYPILVYTPILFIVWVPLLFALIRSTGSKAATSRNTWRAVAFIWLVVGGLVAFLLSTLPNFDTTGSPEPVPLLVMEGVVLLIFAILIYKAYTKHS